MFTVETNLPKQYQLADFEPVKKRNIIMITQEKLKLPSLKYEKIIMNMASQEICGQDHPPLDFAMDI